MCFMALGPVWTPAGPHSAAQTGILEMEGRTDVATSHLKAEFPLPQGSSVFFLLTPSADWIPSPVMEGNLLFSKSNNLHDILKNNLLIVIGG